MTINSDAAQPALAVNHWLLYAVVLIEGYCVLAVELLVIRLLIPFVGTGTDTISIIIAAVLMPLSVGYWAGGTFRNRGSVRIRRKLISNLLQSIVILSIGLSYIVLVLLFEGFQLVGIESTVLSTAIYCLIFISYPVFLLGQTIPLISNYFSHGQMSRVTGKMLFFSTTGSFLGSVASTLVLMSLIGVHNTVIVTVSLLVIILLILSKKLINWSTGLALAALYVVFSLNNTGFINRLGIVENNQYSTIRILDDRKNSENRILSINGGSSSKYAAKFDERHPYNQYIETTFLDFPESKPQKSILVIGAGGFMLGLDDDVNEYTYVDIDPSLKEISEELFLKHKLGPNKKFEAIAARAFFARNGSKKYDVIVLDAFSNRLAVPQQLLTADFFADVKSAIKEPGFMVFNYIGSPGFKTQGTVKLDNTLRSVFGNLDRRVVRDHNMWAEDRPQNIIYSAPVGNFSKDIYTDDLNTYFLDRKTTVWR